MNTRPHTAPSVDGALDLGSDPSALARLAFGNASHAGAFPAGAQRHLALLGPEALDFDLGDPHQSVLGDHELREKLGQGGMGVVYRAYHRALDREVAVKLLSAGPWAAPDCAPMTLSMPVLARGHTRGCSAA